MAWGTDFKHRAFLSYSHADSALARLLHTRIEAFPMRGLSGRKTPLGEVPATLRPVFLDREDFSAGHALSVQTLAALEASAALIVLCSPASAASHYVNEEIRLFKSRWPGRLVIPVIAAGKPGDAAEECFAPALRFKVDAGAQITAEPEELLAADLREECDGRELAIAKVVAALIGVSSDEVFQRAERERRAARARARRGKTLVFALAALLIASGAGWWQQAWLQEQYFRLTLMDMSVLTAPDEKEKSAHPGTEFKECLNGCPTMVIIPPGKFVMGSPIVEKERSEDEGPQHEVTIAKPFAVSKFAVTFAEWDVCTAAGACPKATDIGWGRDDRPVINVNWVEAKQYAAWLSRMSSKSYRLLSEAEWEYAGRAGSTAIYSWGDGIGTGNTNCNGCGSQWDGKRTAPVGSFIANRFGLYDMHGNASQWVEDCYHDNYNGAPSDGSAWATACTVSSRRVARGGSWNNYPSLLRAAYRIRPAFDYRSFNLGLRIARTMQR